MIINVASAAALNAALKGASAGDTILLAPGTYAGVSASFLNFSQPVTIASLNADQPATITSLKVTSSSGLVFRDLDMQVLSTGGDNPFQVARSQNVVLTQLSVHGSLDGDPTNDRSAFLIRDSQNVTVSDSEFHDLLIGLGHLNTERLTIEGNTFKTIQLDGIRGGGSSFITIRGNTFSDFHPKAGDHADAIQFWTTNTTTSAHDIVVLDNLFFRGDGRPASASMQGIFFNDEVGTLPYQRVTIEGNTLLGLNYNSIVVLHGEDVTVRNNVVASFPDLKARIWLDKVDGAVVAGNEATYFVLPASNTNLSSYGNITIPTVTDGGQAYLAEWQAAHAGAPSVGASTIAGTSGADTLTGTEGADVMGGANGDDVYLINHSGDAAIETASGGDDLVMSGVSHILGANVERLTLTGGADINGEGNALANLLSGNAGANILTGAGGADTLSGGDGADTLLGGDGADKLVGGLGVDRFEGGAGNDYYVVDDPRELIVEATGAGDDLVASSASYTLGANVERLSLGAGAIDGVGNGLANSLKGGAGANRLNGLGGNDTLAGMDGADTLNGGAGGDLLSGGAGIDRFVIARGEGNGDRILDFASDDVLVLTGYSPGSTLSAVTGSTTGWVIWDAASGARETIQISNGYRFGAGDWVFE